MVKLAEAYGAQGFRVNSMEEFQKAVDEVLAEEEDAIPALL